jgi:hypothetical protein
MKTIIISALLLLTFINNISAQCTANAGPDITVCGLTANLVATENIDDVNTHWLPQAGITFSDINSPITTVAASYPGTFHLIWQITNSLGNTCTDTITVTFQTIPTSNFNVQTPTCINTPTSVVYTGSVMSPNTYSWNFNGANIQTGALPGPYTLTWNTVGTYNISLTVTSAYGCVSNTTTQAVVVLPNGPNCCIVPTPNAGVDTIVCGYLYEFENSAPAPGNVITWTQLSGPGFSNFIPGPNYTVTVSALGIYQFQLTEVNGACDSSDIVIVNFGMPPTPDAGPDQTVCGIYANLCAIPTVQGGTWSCPQGGIAYYDAINGNFNASYKDSACTTIRYASPNQMITMYWYENNGICPGYDSVTVYFGSIQPALSLVGQGDTLACGPSFSLLNAQQPAFGNGYWQDNIQNTIFSPSPNNTSPTVTIDNFSYGYHEFQWITMNGTCSDTSDVVRVKFTEQPIAYAGTDTTICGIYTQMNATLNTNETGSWLYFPGDFPWTVAAAHHPLTSMVASQHGTYHCIWQVSSNDGNCLDSDTVQIIFDNALNITGLLSSSSTVNFTDYHVSLFKSIANSEAQLSETGIVNSLGQFNLYPNTIGDYYLKAEQIIPSNTSTFINTYYNNTWEWNNAQTITLNQCGDSVSIALPLYNYSPANGGLCKVSGKVRYDGTLTPVTDATVILVYEPVDEPAGLVLTNSTGNYQFNNLPLGSYSVYVDIPGIPQITTHSIIVAAGDTLFDNVNFIVDTTSISKQYGFGIYADTSSFIGVNQLFINDLDFSVFPNPASDYIKIISNNLNDKAIITIYNIEGKKMIEETISQSHNIIYINKLNSGLYTIEIKNDKFVKREKLVKQ